MSKWVKHRESNYANGEKTIVYKAKGVDAWIESRKVAVPHANRSGYWLHTTYFVCSPDGSEKEYWKLTDAQEAAEGENEN